MHYGVLFVYVNPDQILRQKFRNAKDCNLPLLGSSHLNEAQKVDLEAAEFKHELIPYHHSREYTIQLVC